MQKQGLRLLTNIISVYMMVNVFSFMEAGGINQIIIFSVILWLINIFLRPILLLITLPINVLTLGIFTLLINTWIIMIADKIIKGVHIPGFWIAFLLSISITVIDNILKKVSKN